MDLRLSLLVVALLGIVLLIRRQGSARWLALTEPNRPWVVPLIVAGVVVAVTIWTWGGLRAPAVIHDEAAYLLQADLFAKGAWSRAQSGPPEAFAQPAVLVTPVVAPKMPPGHALLLAPGVAVGLPGLVPVILIGIAAATFVALGRRLASSSVAIVAVAVWLTQAGQMRWRASYLSQSTTGALWLVGWWCLFRWRDSRRGGWLIAVALCAGLGAVTRPLTMLAWAVPIGLVVLADVVRIGLWRQLGAALMVGLGCLALLPLQNFATLGDWRKSPLTLYTRQYMPWDVIGFGLVTTPPSLPVPAGLDRAVAPLIELHRQHTVRRLPAILKDRLEMLRRQAFGLWRILWIPAAIVGLALLRGPGLIGLASVVAVYLAYLLYAHEPQWTAYYAETTPVVGFVVALGLAWLLARASGQGTLPLPAAVGVAVTILATAGPELANGRRFRAAAQAPLARFDESGRTASGGAPSLVFVRPDPGGDAHLTLVRNVADLDEAPIVTAHDLGDDLNAATAAAFPNRIRLYYDQATDRIGPQRTATVRSSR